MSSILFYSTRKTQKVGPNWRAGRTLLHFLTSIVAKHQKIEREPLGENVLTMPEKLKGGTPPVLLVSLSVVCYAEKKERLLYFSSLCQTVQLDICFVELCRTILVSSCGLKKRVTIIVAFHFMKRRLKSKNAVELAWYLALTNVAKQVFFRSVGLLNLFHCTCSYFSPTNSFQMICRILEMWWKKWVLFLNSFEKLPKYLRTSLLFS